MKGIGPSVEPSWWDFSRQLIIFVTGIGTIIYATVTPGHDVAFLATGLVLIGFVPVERFISVQIRKPESDDDSRDST